MSDMISRQSAIDAVEFGITYAKAIDVNTGESKELFKEGNDALKNAVERLKELPSAEPERKKGRWKMEPDPYGFFEEIPVCSECGCTTEMRKTYNFCPNCGADMRGEKDR